MLWLPGRSDRRACDDLARVVTGSFARGVGSGAVGTVRVHGEHALVPPVRALLCPVQAFTLLLFNTALGPLSFDQLRETLHVEVEVCRRARAVRGSSILEKLRWIAS